MQVTIEIPEELESVSVETLQKHLDSVISIRAHREASLTCSLLIEREKYLGAVFANSKLINDASRRGGPLCQGLHDTLSLLCRQRSSTLIFVQSVLKLKGDTQSNECDIAIVKPPLNWKAFAIPTQDDVRMIIEVKATLTCGVIKKANQELAAAHEAGLPTFVFGYQATDKETAIRRITIVKWMSKVRHIDGMFVLASNQSWAGVYVRCRSTFGKHMLTAAKLAVKKEDSKEAENWLYMEVDDETPGIVLASIVYCIAVFNNQTQDYKDVLEFVLSSRADWKLTRVSLL